MSLKKEFLSGIFYTAVSKYSGILISLLVSSVLARLLTPKEFGVVGVATVIIAFFNILGDIGIGPAIVQNKELSKNDICSIHTFTTYLGVVLALIFFISSNLIARIYNDYNLVYICRWLSISIAFTCWGIVPLNLNYKSKKFKKIAAITLLVQLLSGFGACLYAVYGGGVYALILQFTLSSILLSIMYNYFSEINWSFTVSRESLMKIKSFSFYQFLFNLLSYFSRNSDKLLIGKFLGLSQLGYYEKSYRLMMLPLQNVSFVLTPVILPIFSNIQEDKRLIGEKYFKLIIPLSYLAFPMSILFYFCAPELILIIFGPQWYPSIKPLQILSFTIGFQILVATTGGIFQAINETKRMFYSGCWGAFFIIISFIISIVLWNSVNAICMGYLFAQIANVIQCFVSLFNALEIKPIIFFKSLVKPICLSLFVFAILYITTNYILLPNMWIQLIVKLALGGLITFILIQLISPFDFIRIFKNYKTIKK